MVDAHFQILTPTNPAISMMKIPRDIFLCFLIRWIFINANQTIPPIYAVLESVRIIASIQSIITKPLSMAVTFPLKNSRMEFIFCLHSNTIIGKNAIKKYP